MAFELYITGLTLQEAIAYDIPGYNPYIWTMSCAMTKHNKIAKWLMKDTLKTYKWEGKTSEGKVRSCFLLLSNIAEDENPACKN